MDGSVSRKEGVLIITPGLVVEIESRDGRGMLCGMSPALSYSLIQCLLACNQLIIHLSISIGSFIISSDQSIANRMIMYVYRTI